MYEQLSKILITNNPFSTICTSISSNNIVNLGDINWGEHTRKNHKLKYSLLKKPAQSHSSQEQLYCTSSLLTKVSSYSTNLLGKNGRLVSLRHNMLAYVSGFVAMLITRWIVIVERYIKAESRGNSSSCLSSCSFERDWLLLEEMNNWSLEVGNSFILLFFSVPCALWLVSLKCITQHLADI